MFVRSYLGSYLTLQGELGQLKCPKSFERNEMSRMGTSYEEVLGGVICRLPWTNSFEQFHSMLSLNLGWSATSWDKESKTLFEP